MCVNDVLVQGAEPLFFLDYFATGKLRSTPRWRWSAASPAAASWPGCALIGGETAGDARHVPAGRVRPRRLLRGRGGKVGDRRRQRHPAGDAILGIASSGAHSNGYSLIRHRRAPASRPERRLRLDREAPLADALLAPTTIYVKPILR